MNGPEADRVVLVTGAAGGIGSAVCRRLADHRTALAVADRDVESAREIALEVRSAGGRAEPFGCDLSRPEEVEALVASVVERFGALHGLCTVAGSIRRGDITELTPADWRATFEDNLDSVFLTCRTAVPQLAKAGGGSIVTIASGWGLRAGRRAAAYCAAKAGVVMLTQAMALDHASAGIRANCVAPGDVRTSMLEREAHQLGRPVAEFYEEAADRPLGRVGEPREIADAVSFLLGEESSFVTGAVLTVDGGGTL
ncbi:SDR family NAD(P)-dependent oxidoreductase [Streptomyces violascens]|uniref:Short-chain dehydrogenase n=1 Tax=Streptomyces violascens TaxID=67381 RepID=A0ABQ3QFY6_9ACTN|nr:SDR family NAD(P)-dependent oxidoreductase [Streptomyces violascens]GGT88219.1 short-chain dehydrogenase [Streptomyces violascens]GHI36193.1 short-chain dehydrogenase [Streptomyces violascens]